ncbi:hypothetical protein [Mesorhizobium sp. WSM4313]|uniref:hypothetical protein n=1 Tax=Mesorhizobium sp. WSM4313 TaxID=2029412 RepID=UPI000BB0755D|nr:hypothetical protein [Mesorhizobium sp. WSM4313]PBB20554.1 hypothetical protein CK219_05300 [Mesorhizobium sp. WSM4313]
MTAYYVRSGAAGAGTGADWANAYTTLAAAYSGKAAGDIFYISEDHAESQATTLTLTSPGTLSNPCLVLCVNHSGSVPPVSADLRTTATISTTGNVAINIAGNGTFYYGIIFTAGNSTGSPILSVPSANNASARFVNCSLRLGSTGGGSISIGSSGGVSQAGYVDLENTTVQFASTSQSIIVTGTLRWRNTASALLGTIPGVLFTFNATRGGRVLCTGVDFSAAGSGKTLVGNSTGPTGISAEFTDCKVNAAVTLAATPGSHDGPWVDFVRTGSSGVNYTQSRYRYTGTLTEETTIVRTGGASDGATPLAWKIVTTANSSVVFPFESIPIAIWNDTTGSAVTATIQGIWGGGAVPNDDEIWIEVEYLGDASSPQGSFVNDSKADPLASAAGQTAGSGTWGGSTTKFELSKSFTPQQKGWIFVRVKAAKPSSTFYIDPKITLS